MQKKADFVLIGTGHHQHGIDRRERFAIDEQKAEKILRKLQSFDWFCEGVIISTCYRSELFGIVKSPQKLQQWWAVHVLEGEDERCYLHSGIKALNHHMAVACGLDSKIIGESQVFGQYKKAYDQAREINQEKSLEHFRLKLWQQIKKIRTESALGRHCVRLEKYIFKKIDDFATEKKDLNVVLIGSGQVMREVIRQLSRHDWGSLQLVVRDREKVKAFAEGKKQLELVSIGQLKSYLLDAHVVISATSCPHYIVERRDFVGHKRRLLIDLAVPRDINPDVGQVEHFDYFDMDQLIAGFDDRTQEKQKAKDKAIALVEEQAKNLHQWFKNNQQESTVMKWFNKNLTKNGEQTKCNKKQGRWPLWVDEMQKSLLNTEMKDKHKLKSLLHNACHQWETQSVYSSIDGTTQRNEKRLEHLVRSMLKENTAVFVEAIEST